MPNALLPPASLSLQSLACDLLPETDSKVTPGIARALLSMASLQDGWDANATVPTHRPWLGADQGPLLPFLMNRAPFDRASSVVRPWPSELTGFGPALAEAIGQRLVAQEAREKRAGYQPAPEAVDVEWLAAVLLAGGADPWVDRSEENPLGTTLSRALEHNMVGLVQRLMALPGAPSWAEVADAPVWSSALSVRARESWLHAIAANREPRPELLEAMLSADPKVPAAPHPLSKAFPWALGVYATLEKLPREDGEIKTLLSAWRARLKSKELSAEGFGTMETAVSGKPSDLVDSQATALFVQELSSMGWGATWTSNRPEPTALGPDALNARAEVPKGGLAGQWSRAAVLVVQYLRAFGAKGVQNWDASSWCASRKDRSEVPEGALKAARGFDWRPGQSIDGILMLGIYGVDVKEGDALLSNYAVDMFKSNLRLFGIQDGPGWARAQLESAVSFTEALVGRGSTKVNHRMGEIWGVVASRLPGLFDDRPELLQRLLRCLIGPDETPIGTIDSTTERAPDGKGFITGPSLESHRKLSPLIKHATPADWALNQAPSFAELSTGWQAVAVEVGLLLATEAWKQAFVEGARSLTSSDQERALTWAKAQEVSGESQDRQAFVAQLTASMLDASLPENFKERSFRPRF